jgi:transcriptional regulator with XRE-family HTH domain
MRQSASARCQRCTAVLAQDNRDLVCAACQITDSGNHTAPPTVPDEFWDHQPIRDALASQHMGQVVRAYRRHPHHRRPLAQDTVARWFGITQAQLSRIEARKPPRHLDTLASWAQLLGIPARLLWFTLPGAAADATQPTPAEPLGVPGQLPEPAWHRQSRAAPDPDGWALNDHDPPITGAALGNEPPDVLDAAREIEARRQHLAASNVDEARLKYLEAAVRHLITENERRSPAVLAPQVRDLRRYVETLLSGRQHPPQRQRLYTVAAQLGGLLGVLALDLGAHGRAHAYGLEAFELADATHQPNLQAWVRAGQSLIAYYRGDFHEALAYARDGLKRAPAGPQSVRLTVNGEARALARLGDSYGVDAAVERAFVLLGRFPIHPAVSPSLATDTYCPTRAAANAATAYLALGMPNKVEEYGTQALVAFDAAGLHGPQALSRLDLATASLTGQDPDPDRAAALVIEAMAVTADERFASVNQRALEFLAAAHPWVDQPSVRQAADLIAHRVGQNLDAGRPI